MTTTSPMPVSLPSIHEMFPEHLLKMSPGPRTARHSRSNGILSNSDSTIYSFDVLRSDPTASSLQHIASSATFSNRASAGPSRTVLEASNSPTAFRIAGPSSGVSSNRLPHESTRPQYHLKPTPSTSEQHTAYSSEEMSDDGDDKKHVCTTCGKRFNRPSSLRIHMNTHTGATPFRCPYPSCGREFNVNSNMRRHFRNHSTPANSRSQGGKEDLSGSAGARRRKRRASSPSASPQSTVRSTANTSVQHAENSIYPPQAWNPQERHRYSDSSSPTIGMAEDSDSESSPSLPEEDELMDDDSYSESSTYFRQPTSSFRLQPVTDFHERYPPSRYNQSDIRSLPPPPRPVSASSSASPPPSSPNSAASSIPSCSPVQIGRAFPSVVPTLRR